MTAVVELLVVSFYFHGPNIIEPSALTFEGDTISGEG